MVMARLATRNESQTRRAKALRLALIFLPLEYLYFFALPGYLALEAVAVNGEEPGGVYCGTTTGQIYFRRNDAKSWEKMVDNLPRINSLCGTRQRARTYYFDSKC